MNACMTPHRIFLLVVFAMYCVSSIDWSQEPREKVSRIWSSEPPADTPFIQSREITGLAFTGRYANYGAADTWYPTWAGNGNLYSPWTDGKVNGVEAASWKGPKATTGYVTILGDDPLHLSLVDAASYPDDPTPCGGRYPSGSLIYKGIWYYGTYCLYQTPGKNLNWDILGPFVGFRYSSDYGKTWHGTTHTPAHPLFSESAQIGGKIKMGVPHFVDFGRNMQNSPDGKAYLVAQGSSDAIAPAREPDLSWITANQVYLARVKPSIRNMDRAGAYEFFGGYNLKGQAIWTKDFRRIQPLLTWKGRMGNVAVTYDAPLKKYLMAVTDGGNTVSKFNTFILESSYLTGPWALVTYMRNFGEQGYFVNFPSKFISADGRTAWLSYSANFTNSYLHTGYKSDPVGGGYCWTLQEALVEARK
jgi:hypothetical protein